MAGVHKGKIVKCDQKVNITAAFGAELVLEGATSIPNILLRYYNKLGITDFQMILLIQLIRFISDEKVTHPTPEMLSECMEAEPERIRRELANLIDKETIAVSDFFDSTRRKVFPGYDLEPLFLQVSDIWAGIRSKEIEEAENLLRITADGRDFDNKQFDDNTGKLIKMFENEFGKVLSPIEIDQIEKWVAEAGAVLVAEALKQAVLRSKYNFKYINSILTDWKKNSIETLEDVVEFERQFQSRRTTYPAKKNKIGNKGMSHMDSASHSRKKDFIKSLYI